MNNNQPQIKVSIIGVTTGEPAGLTAPQLLAYTKATRLEQGEGTRAKIAAMTKDEESAELEYMSETIPSSWEFIDYTFEILNVTRAFTHQLVRTRTGSYAQQAMRVLPMRGFTYRMPPRLLEPDMEQERHIYESGMAAIQACYDTLLQRGVHTEDARGLLPTNIHTNIIAKFNLRALADLVKARTGARVQDEYREVAELMRQRVVELHPWAKVFLYPAYGKHVRALEDAIKRATAFGAWPKEEETRAFKHLDALKKELK
jgi:flavin-dependent thymidylate synthase